MLYRSLTDYKSTLLLYIPLYTVFIRSIRQIYLDKISYKNTIYQSWEDLLADHEKATLLPTQATVLQIE